MARGWADLIQPKGYSKVATGALDLTDATSAVQVHAASKDVKMVYVNALNGLIAVGDSSCRADSSNEQGTILYPGNPPTPFPVEDLNLLYAAGASGTRLCYAYYW